MTLKFQFFYSTNRAGFHCKIFIKKLKKKVIEQYMLIIMIISIIMLILFSIWICLCTCHNFSIILEQNKTNSLSVFDSDLMDVRSYANLTINSIISGECPHDNIGFVYLGSFTHTEFYINKIKLANGNESDKFRIFISNIVIDENNNLYGIRPRLGYYDIAQIIDNHSINKYNFSTNVSFIFDLTYVESTKTFIVATRDFPDSNFINNIYVIHDWKT